MGKKGRVGAECQCKFRKLLKWVSATSFFMEHVCYITIGLPIIFFEGTRIYSYVFPIQKGSKSEEI
jgi:hypothetical protein